MRRAILTAAGLGSRLKPHTDDRPKCMVEVAGEPMLHRATRLLRSAGMDDIVAVVGYLSERVNAPGLRKVHNPRYEKNNSLASLFCARDEMGEGFVFSYTDIVYDASVPTSLLEAPGDLVLVVDRGWRKAYEGRSLHPLSEAEVAVAAPDGRLLDVGKGVDPAHSAGEFIGMGKLTARGAQVALAAYREAERSHQTRGTHPFHRAKDFERAYLTDLFLFLAQSGVRVDVCYVDEAFMEIDTPQDLERAHLRFGARA